MKLARDRCLAAKAKRLGEEWFFSGAFVVFRYISVIFRAFCLEVLRLFPIFAIDKGC